MIIGSNYLTPTCKAIADEITNKIQATGLMYYVKAREVANDSDLAGCVEFECYSFWSTLPVFLSNFLISREYDRETIKRSINAVSASIIIEINEYINNKP